MKEHDSYLIKKIRGCFWMTYSFLNLFGILVDLRSKLITLENDKLRSKVLFVSNIIHKFSLVYILFSIYTLKHSQIVFLFDLS